MTYTFEYLFLPKIINNSNQSDFSLESTILLDSLESLHISFSQHYPHQSAHFDWAHFSIRKEMKEGLEYWLLTFPEPQTEPEALWGIVVHYEDQPYQYYTFERGSGNKYYFCQLLDGRHINCGSHPQDLPLESFIHLALRQAKRE